MIITSMSSPTLNPCLVGSNCEVDINECATDPCLYGECQDSIAKYICLCNPGYEGVNCDEEINECERYSPCQHGTCTGNYLFIMSPNEVKLNECIK